MTPLDIKPEFNDHEFSTLLVPLVQNKKKKIKIETFHRRKDGSEYPVEVHLQQSNFGGHGVFIAMIIDITERKNYTERLEKKVKERTSQLSEALSKEKELNELKTRFLSLVSHEFKTPLSGILTSAALIGTSPARHASSTARQTSSGSSRPIFR